MFRLPDKGTFAYFKNRKKVTGRLTAIGFLTVLVIFLTGVIIYHNNKSIFTVIAAVAVLPAAKMLVSYIITAGFESVSKEKNINHDEARKFLISCINETLQYNINH